MSSDHRSTTADVIALWRVLAAVAVGQLIGGAVGTRVFPYHSGFHRHWLGMALATPLAFVAGVMWYLAHTRRLTLPPGLVLACLGVLAFGLGAGAVFLEKPSLDAELENIAALRSMPEGSLRRIAVYDEYCERLLVHIEHEGSLRDFVRACRDAEGYSPSHPGYTHSWYLFLDDDDHIELTCHYEPRHPDKVVGDFSDRSGTSTRYQGTFISRNLRSWFEEHVRR
jgi:hypothetical protein